MNTDFDLLHIWLENKSGPVKDQKEQTTYTCILCINNPIFLIIYAFEVYWYDHIYTMLIPEIQNTRESEALMDGWMDGKMHGKINIRIDWLESI